MQQAAGELLDFDARAEQVIHVATAGITDEERVNPLRHDQGDTNTPCSRCLQPLKQGIVRHEIRRGHHDFVLGVEDGAQQHVRHVG